MAEPDPGIARASGLAWVMAGADGRRYRIEAFLEVMTARHRAGLRLAAAEALSGAVPEVRQLAQQMVAELQAQIEQMTAWLRA